MERLRGRSGTGLPAAVAVAYAAFALWVLTASPQAFSTTVVVDLTETAVPAAAGVTCLLTARRWSDHRRRGWRLIGWGILAWAAGQGVWSWYEVVERRAVPFPSLADLGYLAFPVLATIGVFVYSRHAVGWSTGRRVLLDGALISVSLLTVSWLTALGAVYEAGGATIDFAISLAYPVGDLIMVAAVLQCLSRLSGVRRPLWVLAAGLTLMGVADSAFVWQVTTGTFGTGGLTDLGWIAAFLLMGLAAYLDRGLAPTSPTRRASLRARILLPYVPFAAGITGIGIAGWVSQINKALIVLGFLLIALVLVRQFLGLLENHDLLAELQAREVQLQHLAFHDPLTGLANRALFTDRLRHAAERGVRERTELTALFVDLDDFKTVNDTLGHGAGDQVLVSVADRLRGCTRSADTVARLGGDEFAVLLSPGSAGAGETAARIVAALSNPVYVGSREVPVSASVGVSSTTTGGDAVEVTTELMRQADVAMYTAKAAGKDRYRSYDVEVDRALV